MIVDVVVCGFGAGKTHFVVIVDDRRMGPFTHTPEMARSGLSAFDFQNELHGAIRRLVRAAKPFTCEDICIPTVTPILLN